MDSMPGLVLYGAVKLLAYSGWCLFGLRCCGAAVVLRGGLGRALRLGTLRWLLGLVIGVLLFFLIPVSSSSEVVPTYLAIYVPVRVVEWALIAHWLLPEGFTWGARFRVSWIAGGIVLSFLTDLTSPEMIEQGRFCVGRCLC